MAVKKLKNIISISIIICALLGGVGVALLLSSCETPMGLGKPVDLNPPSIRILKPGDNEFLRGIAMGTPIDFAGTCEDDFGVKELKTKVYRVVKPTEENNYKTEELVSIPGGDFKYKISSNNTWSASIKLPGEGVIRYKIVFLAVDNFNNSGSHEVYVNVDLIAPWVRKAEIIRHPESSLPFKNSLKEVSFYEELEFKSISNKEIEKENIDDFQNEAFNLKLEIAFEVDKVAASRLDVYLEDGTKLNDKPLKPTSKQETQDDIENPQWRITHDEIEEWSKKNADNKLGYGAHYIYFVAMAWNTTSWDPKSDEFNGGGTYPGESFREQKIDGTVWFSLADYPHVRSIDDISSGRIILESNKERAFGLHFYDDDQISEIYGAIIPEDKMNILRGSETEADYLESLAVDVSERNVLFADADLKLVNLYDFNLSPDGRSQTVYLNSGDVGEYRLLAMVKDKKVKDANGGSLDTINEPLWTVHTPLRITVQKADSPLIVVTNPEREGIFPPIFNNHYFKLAGNTIDNSGVDAIQIAWVPFTNNYSITSDHAISALENVQKNSPLQPGAFTEITSGAGKGIKIWKFEKGARDKMMLNNKEYIRDYFSKDFDLLSDFNYEGILQNEIKLFVIQAIKGADNFTYTQFQVSGNKEPPYIEVINPPRNPYTHNIQNDLPLRMKIQSPIGLIESTINITDVTSGNLNKDRFMSQLVSEGGEWRRVVDVNPPGGFVPEGTTLTYLFEATNMLGIKGQVERQVTMSNKPTLQYITSTETPGMYGIGKTLFFEAVFSLPVRVMEGSGTGPKLKLYFSDPLNTDPTIIVGTNGILADYDSVAGNTIRFKYTVIEGHNANILYNSISPIDLNNSQIISTEATVQVVNAELALPERDKNSIHARKQIGLDGKRPSITSAGFTQPANPKVPGSAYFNDGKTVTLELNLNEIVRVSGSPIAKIAVGSGNDKIISAEFSKIEATQTNSKLYFTYTVSASALGSIPESNGQLRWVSPWFDFSNGSSIIDMADNEFRSTSAGSVPSSPDALNGVNLNKKAWIITQAPPAPSFTVHSASSPTTGNRIDVNGYNNTAYLSLARGTNINSTDLYYSLEGGNSELSYTNAASAVISDKNRSNNNSETYAPSEYKITAWQIDYAGNRSVNADIRDFIINSRFPDIVDITCTEPNGSYNAGKTLNFKVVFSRNVRTSNGNARLTLHGTATGDTNPSPLYQIPVVQNSNNAGDTSLTFTWANIPSGLRMRNIKATVINLSGVVDVDFNNSPKNYSGTTEEDAPGNTTTRPITNSSSFNLNRGPTTSPVSDGLVVDSIGPVISSTNPSAPTTTGQNFNGDLLNKEPLKYSNTLTGIDYTNDPDNPNIGKIEDGEIVINFDKPVWANSGKKITIKPYGNWAIPPVLTSAEMDELYNSPDYGANQQEYQRRLKWVDANNLPDLGGRTVANAFAQRGTYNSYTYTTHGITKGSNNYARPDTTGKWVLAFDRDLYNATSNGLRDVFNAAKWKWQEIYVTSGSVVIDPADRRKVTITLPQTLERGRIWEITIETGAFRDAAGNESPVVAANTANYNGGTGYRFWSKGTADPVIRADRHSHGDNFHSHPASYRGDWNTIPYTDIKVRIDCETPGAEIYYDVYRTKYTLNPGDASAGQTGTTSNVFSSTEGSEHQDVSTASTTQDANFFKHTGISGVHTNAANRGRGYANNSIGNGRSHPPAGGANGSVQVDPLTDSEKYFSELLIPNLDETDNVTAITGTTMVNNNGAVLLSVIENFGNTRLISSTNLAKTDSIQYRSLAAAGNDFTKGNQVINVTGKTYAQAEAANGWFFYAGDAFKRTGAVAENDRNPLTVLGTGATLTIDRKLATGRRDYVIAAAQKNSHTILAAYAGPGLDVSKVSYEGIYKTTVIHRNPANGLYWLTIMGYDTPQVPTVPGFPLNALTAGYKAGQEHIYYSKQYWRVTHITTAVTPADAGNWPASITANIQTNLQRDNHHIWVSWDIVTDWYINGRAKTNTKDDERPTRGNVNSNSILATYGAVTYRFRQNYWYSGYDDGNNWR